MSSLNYFNEVAAEWDKMRSGFFKSSLREKIINLAKLSSGNIIADVGAGTGFLTEELLKSDVEVMALDQSEEMLATMKSKYGDKRISYFPGESENWPIRDETVNVAMANMFLHHVENPQNTIKELYRILCSGGKVIISDLDQHDHSFLLKEHNDRWPGFKRSDIEKWFRSAGFNNIEILCAEEECCAESEDNDDKAEISIFIATGVK